MAVDYSDFYKAAGEKYGVDPGLLAAVAQTESSGNKNAVGPPTRWGRAEGLMQIIPPTAKSLDVDPSDPEQAIHGAAKLLRAGIDKFGNVDDAVASYHGGPDTKLWGPKTRAYREKVLSAYLDPKGSASARSGPSDDEIAAAFGAGSPAPTEASAQPDNHPAKGLSDDAIAAAFNAVVGGPAKAEGFLDPGVFNPKTGSPYNPAQAKTLRGMQARGEIDLDATPGSRWLPFGQTSEDDQPPPGAWYVNRQGDLIPGSDLGDGSVLSEALKTFGRGAQMGAEAYGLLNPGANTLLSPLINSERQDALRQGAMSGFALGGKNEIISAAGAIPAAISGGWGAGVDQFDQNLQELDTRDAELSAAYPKTMMAGRVVGALAPTALAPIVAPASLAGRIGVGAGVGAAEGGLGGYLGTDGSNADRLGAAATGTVLGGVLGGVLGPVAARAPKGELVQPINQLLSTGAPAAAREISSDQGMAANAILRALQRDETNPQAIIETARKTGTLPFAAGGENLAGLAEVAAQSPGKARTALTEAIGAREAKAVDRIKGEVGNALGGRGDYFSALDALATKRATDAKTGMEAIGHQMVNLDENSVAAVRSELSRSAFQEAGKNALASTDPAVRDAGARLLGLSEAALDHPGSLQMTVREVQDVSYALKEAADAAYKSGNNARGKALKGLSNALRDNAKDPERGGVDGYAQWLKSYGDESSNKDALELGYGILENSRKKSSETFQKAFDDMSDAEKDNFRKGVGEALLQKVRSGRGGVNTMRDLLRSEDVAERVKIAFPDETAFRGFMEAAKREVDEAAKHFRVLGNSRTSFRDAAREDLTREASQDPLDMLSAAGEVVTGNAPAIAKRALKAIPRKDRNALTNPEANKALGEALTDTDALIELLTSGTAKNIRKAKGANAQTGRTAGVLGRLSGLGSSALERK